MKTIITTLFLILFVLSSFTQTSNNNLVAHEAEDKNGYTIQEIFEERFVKVDVAEGIYRELKSYGIANSYNTTPLTRYYLDNINSYKYLFKKEIIHIYKEQKGTAYQSTNKQEDLLYSRGEIDATVKNVVAQIINDYHQDGFSKNIFTSNSTNHIKFPKKIDKAAGEECNNPDFETCDFTGWEMFVGEVNDNPYEFVSVTSTNEWCSESTGVCYNSGGGGAPCGCSNGDNNCAGQNDCVDAVNFGGTCICTDCPCDAGGNDDPSHHTVTSGTDAVTGVISKVHPDGGGCAAVIGDLTGTGGRAASIVQTFRVSGNSSNFTYRWAAVLEDPDGHDPGEKPYFKVNLFDSNGDPIACGSYEAVAGDGKAGWITGGGGDYVYKDWTTVLVPLQNYIGQDVTIEFIIGDCSQGGHYGYAYVDMLCAPLDILIGSSIPCGPTTLTAPDGAVNYLWAPTGETTRTITPGVTGTYTVTITPVTGPACNVVLDSTVTIELKSITANFTNTTPCLGAQIDFTDASTATGTTLDTWSWDFGDGNTSTQQNPSHTYASVGSKNVTLAITSPDGCTDNIVIPVNVISCGTAVSLVGDTICIGETGTLTATGSEGALNYAFDWTGGGITGNSDNGTTDPSIVTQTDNPTVTTTYTVVITDNGGNKDTATADIVVNPLPIVIAATDIDICIGSIAPINASGAATYVWDNGLPATAGPHSVSPGTTTTYTVTGTDVNGCINDSTVTITVNPLPTITTADESICWEDSVQICASGGVSYTWASGNGGLFGADSTSACVYVKYDMSSPVADSIRIYQVVGTDANGCENTATSTVTFEAVCGPTVEATGDTICIGEVAQLTTVVTATTGTVFYAWTPITGLDDPTIANPTVTGLAITTTYQVIITDDLGTDTDSATIVINPLPLVIAATDTAICIGASATVSASGADTYVWDNGLPATAGPHTVTPGATTTYTVTGTDTNGCVNDSTVTITVNPLPTITVPDATICKDDPTTVTASGGDTYTWVSLDGGLIISGATTPTLEVATDEPLAVVDVTKRYEVTGTDANGCENTAISTVTFEAVCGPTVVATGDTICDGEIANLTSVVTYTTGTVFYAWTPVAGLDDPTIANPTVTGLTTTTNYQVIITDDLGSDTDYVDIVVNPLPPVSADTDVSICIGASAPVTASGAATYVWDNGLPATAGPHTVSPTATTTYTVIGTDLKGCVNTDSVTITVNPLPDPTSSNDTAICIGESATIAVNSTGAAPITYAWDVNPPGTGAGPHTISPTTTTTYNVTVTDANGCVSTEDVTVTVNPLPVPDAGVDQVICIGESATITATSTGAAPITYTWDQTPPATGAGPHVLSPTVTTTYGLMVQDNNGCQNTAAMTITVNPLPIPDAGNDVNICINATTQLVATGGNTYVWSTATDLSATNIANPVFTGNTSGSFDKEVTVTDINGCVSKDTVNITVNPLPTIYAGEDTTICPGGTVVLRGAGGLTYSWEDLTTGTISNSPTLSIMPTAAQQCYELTGTDVNGCINTDMVCINVSPNPVADFDAAPVCNGATTSFVNTSTNGNTYLWDFGDGQTSTIANPQHLYLQEGTYNTELTVSSTFGCTNTIIKPVVVKYQPVADFSGINLDGCPPLDVTFFNESDSLDPNFTYLWEFGDGGTFRQEDDTVRHQYVNTGTYSVKLTVSYNGCADTLFRPDYVVVHPVPIADFTVDPEITTIYDPSIDFTNHTIGGDYYIWDFGDSTGANDVNPTHIYSDSGTYTIWLYVENQFTCKDSIAKLLIIRDVFTFFAPNAFTPDGDDVNDTFLPRGYAIDMDEYNLQIFDRWGALFFETNDYYEGWDGMYKGKPVQIDTYIWKVHLRDIYGEYHKYMGRVSVVK